jgi:hypothetical protein
MSKVHTTQQGGGYPFHNSKQINSKTSVGYSISAFKTDYAPDQNQLTLQGFEFLLNEHVGRLEMAIRRHEAYSLQPFPRYMNQKEVISYLGHEKIFWILVEDYGLKPIRQEHRLNIYCSKMVQEKCVMFEFNIAA